MMCRIIIPCSHAEGSTPNESRTQFLFDQDKISECIDKTQLVLWAGPRRKEELSANDAQRPGEILSAQVLEVKSKRAWWRWVTSSPPPPDCGRITTCVEPPVGRRIKGLFYGLEKHFKGLLWCKIYCLKHFSASVWVCTASRNCPSTKTNIPSSFFFYSL